MSETYPDIRFSLEAQGAVRIHSASFLQLSEQAFLLEVDCQQKYPLSIVSLGETLSIIIYPGDRTLHVPKNAPCDEEGRHTWTVLEIHGFSVGDWEVVAEDGKWGPHILGVRKGPRSEEWPFYVEPESGLELTELKV